MKTEKIIKTNAADAEVNRSTRLKILKERAEILAKPLFKEVDNGIELVGLGFLLSDEQYIIDASFVVEVIHINELTQLPSCPPFLMGIINVRGRIISVINLKSFLNLPMKGITNHNRVIIVKHKQIEIGLLADDVTGNITVYPNQLQIPISTLSSRQKEYLLGITIDHAVLLDIEKFLSADEIVINEEI
jgi:purine-binding chemotaxis protein CheW